jgi:hypothetical protein
VKSSLESISNNLRIEVQTGTKNVAFEGNYITGVWKTKGSIYRVGEGRAIALNVLNPFLASDRLVDEVLDFTKKYGPLTVPFYGAESFKFSINEWQIARKYLLGIWRGASSGEKRKWPFNLPLDKNNGDNFGFENGQLTFRTLSLSTFMALEISTVPVKRFRQCANFVYGCKSPYFFADDLRDRYCSEACAYESRKRTKLKWWNDHRKGGENGSQEAR